MAVKLGNGNWAVKEDKLLAYNDNSGLFFNKEFDFSRGTSATYVAKDGLIKTAGIQPNIVNNGDFSELGSEVITNGDFSQSGTPSSSSYTLGWYSPDPGVSISNGELSLTKQSPLCRAYATDGISVIAFLTSGKTYKLVYTVTENNQGATLRYYNGTYININGSVGTHTLYYKAATQYFILLNASDNKTIKLDSVSVKQVDPNDYWTLGTGWSVGDNKATSDASANSYLNQQAYEIGKTYKLGFEVLEGTIELRSAQYSKGTGFYTTGTYSIEVIPTTISTHFYVYTGFGQSSITNITVQEIQTDTPRIDFTNDTKGHLLLEPQSTNLVTQSDGSNWLKSNVTYTANTAISPDGTQNAATLNFSNNNGIFRFRTTSGNPDGRSFTGSVYLKAGTMTDVRLRILGSGSGLGMVTKEITLTDEWQRFDVSRTFSGTGDNVRFRVQPNLQTGTVYFYGGQVEELSYPTSLIYTTGATSTRNADVCNNSGSAQDFNSEEGVLYAEIQGLVENSPARVISIGEGLNFENGIIMSFDTSNNLIKYKVRSNNITTVDISKGGVDRTLNHKIAVVYKVNDFQIWLDGSKVASTTSGAVPLSLSKIQFSDMNVSSSLFYGKVRNVQVFTEALTDEQLEKLTS